MTKLTTHVLDVYSGKPGKGISVELYYISNSERKKITSVKLNNDGRADSPLAQGENFIKGKYELIFYIGDYFKNTPTNYIKKNYKKILSPYLPKEQRFKKQKTN